MTPHQHQTNDSELNFVEQVAAALERSTANDSPSQQAIDSTILALQKLHITPELIQKELDSNALNSNARSNQGRKERMLRIYRYSGLAAAVMLFVAAIVILSQTKQNTALAYEQAKQKALSAKSVSYVCVFETPFDKSEEKHFIQGNLHRREFRKFTIDFWTQKKNYYLGAPDTLIYNYDTKESMQLNERESTAKKWIGSKNSEAKNPMEEMLASGSNDVERIGEETIDGRKTYLYNAKNAKAKADGYQFTTKVAKIWIDAETGYPIRMDSEFVSKEGFIFKLKLDGFKWNEQLDAKLFSFDVPKDYKLLAADAVTPPKDRIEIFGQVIENVKKATSVTFTMKQDIDAVPGTPEAEMGFGKVMEKVFCQGNFIRDEGYQSLEAANIKNRLCHIHIGNSQTKEYLELNAEKKTAKRGKYEPDNEHQSLINALVKLKSDNAKFVREEKIDGKTTREYRVKGASFIGGTIDVMNVWVDPNNDLPMKIVFDLVSPDSLKFHLEFQNFVWNKPLDEKLFAFDVPKDYKVIADEAKPDPLPAAMLLAQVNENVQRATSMSFAQKVTIHGQETALNFTAAGDWLRMEIQGEVQGTRGEIVNIKTREGMGLATIGDRNFALKGVKSPNAQATSDVIAYFASIAKSKDAKFISEEKIFGRTLHLYHATLSEANDGSTCQVWVDPTTKLPARLILKSMSETTDEDGKKGKIATESVCEDFKWNFAVKEEFFTKPVGYTIIDSNDPDAVEEMNAAAAKAKQTSDVPTNGAMQLEVLDNKGKPVTNAKIHVATWATGEKINRDFVTDAQGKVKLKLPEKLYILRIWAMHEGFIPLFTHWEEAELKKKPQLPESFTIKMEPATRIGGIVRDEDGKPIKDAVVEVQLMSRTPSIKMERTATASLLADADMDTAAVTNANGEWSINTIPAGDKVNLRLKISHEDFAGDKSWDDVSPKPELKLKDLRAEKAVYTMKKKQADKKALEEKKTGN